jgi:hypothetical protein
MRKVERTKKGAIKQREEKEKEREKNIQVQKMQKERVQADPGSFGAQKA